jgi:hypothetical protein
MAERPNDFNEKRRFNWTGADGRFSISVLLWMPGVFENILAPASFSSGRRALRPA